MATLKEFEEALRAAGMTNALGILDALKKRDREKRSIAPPRRVVGRKMTAELARSILDLHASTGMTQQEIAFKLGVNQGRVNEVIKRGKWLTTDPHAPEALSRDKAMERLAQRAKARRSAKPETPKPIPAPPRVLARTTIPVFPKVEHAASTASPRLVSVRAVPPKPRIVSAQLAFLDL